MSQKDKPVFIIQMQRMGDLVLTYPLLLWLGRYFPGRPVWVMAEENFYTPLQPLSPPAVYLPWTEVAFAHVRETPFHLVINLSHTAQAAWLAGTLTADEILGPVADASGNRYIRGKWLLYRASLVMSNRHNRFHWADMNALDSIDIATIAHTHWPAPRTHIADADKRTIGLFLGASSKDKRPDASFWSALAHELIQRNFRPILLGGPAEQALGKEVASRLPVSIANMCGQFSLAELVYISQKMALLVTPDTGPMHLAAWTGLLVLNLSMGPVHSFETGPYQPGHYVLRARISCAGCWHCKHARVLCKEHFTPCAVASIIHILAQGRPERLARRRLPGLELFRTARIPEGCYSLFPLVTDHTKTAHWQLGTFWHKFFGAHFSLWDNEQTEPLFTEIMTCYPALGLSMKKALVRLSTDMARALAKGGNAVESNFWKKTPPALQPVRSYLQVSLENAEFSKAAWQEALIVAEKLIALTENS